ncbi:hypothetical protein VTN00DRAFT_6719 [Thermoascus crustaceus]|uniref:uncharacterized protein n=1 Tax=Thermoascus crustaceus TaxID=5088 RepID=UPI0037425E30
MSSTTDSFTIDTPTVLCIAFSLSMMPVATFLSRSLIPSTHTRNRILFFWHAYDALTHLFIEGSFLYECFFSYVPIPTGNGVIMRPEQAVFLGHKDRLYGAAYGTGPSARLWQEYAKADRRWAGADVTVIALELLTVFIGGPAAIYVCYLLYRASSAKVSAVRAKAQAKLWLVAPALATAELYGGWMTFAPEWLTASSQLETSDPVLLWFYLVFFNGLWVVVPLWVLWQAAKEIRAAFVAAEGKKRA